MSEDKELKEAALQYEFLSSIRSPKLAFLAGASYRDKNPSRALVENIVNMARAGNWSGQLKFSIDGIIAELNKREEEK